MKPAEILFSRYTADDGRRMVQVHLGGQPIMGAAPADEEGERRAKAVANQVIAYYSGHRRAYIILDWDGDSQTTTESKP